MTKSLMAGIDLHSNNVVIGLVDRAGRRLACRKLECDLKVIVAFLRPYQKRLKKNRDDSFDTESGAITRLKTATRAFYSQLNGTQKNDLALLVRMTGLGPAFAELTGTKMTKNEPENSR